MTYPTKLNPSRYAQISEATEGLQSLQLGERLIVNGFNHPSGVEKVRLLLYEWISLNGFSGKFRIKRWGDQLFVTRKDAGEFQVRKEKEGLSLALEGVLQTMITAEEPKEYLKKKEELGDITTEEAQIVEARYLEVIG